MAVMELTNALWGNLVESEGRIVNIGSLAGETAPVWGSVYSSTKYALRGLSKAWSKND